MFSFDDLREAVKINDGPSVKAILEWRGEKGEFLDISCIDIFEMADLLNREGKSIAKMLLAWEGPGGERVDATAGECACLRSAVGRGRVSLVRALLGWRGANGRRVDPRARDCVDLMNAIWWHHTLIVREFLKWRDADGKGIDLVPLTNGIWRKFVSVGEPPLAMLCDLLAWRGEGNTFLDPRVEDNELLVKLAPTGATSCLLELMKWRGPGEEYVNFVGKGSAVVYYAVVHGDVELLRRLLQWRGTGGEFLDPHYYTSSMRAAIDAYYNEDVITELVWWRKPSGTYVSMDGYMNRCARPGGSPAALAVLNREVGARRRWTPLRSEWAAAVYRGLRVRLSKAPVGGVSGTGSGKRQRRGGV